MRKHAADQEIRTPTAVREALEDVGRNGSGNPTIGDIINLRYSRRGFLSGSLGVTAIAATVGPLALLATGEAGGAEASAFSFDEAKAGVDEMHHLAAGYEGDILLRWGDKVFADSPEFDPMNQTPAAQARQFGYNNDYVGFVPLDGSSERGLLVVNHEYTTAELMHPEWATIETVIETKDGIEKEVRKVQFGAYTPELIGIEMMAHGGTVIEVARTNGTWAPVLDSPYNRRITAETPMSLSGPVAGAERVRTKADPTGTHVLGTLNNCAGGVTPWGTYLMAEENFHGYFMGDLADDNPEATAYRRYGVPSGWYRWGSVHERFDLAKEPNEPNRFGWIVEVDPLDPRSTPRKRTALGRFKHEGAESVVNTDGRVVLYSGDDERFEYVYKFVTTGTFDDADRAANMDLLDDGTLHVARFDADGTVQWLPLVHGLGPLTAENGFADQADVMIEARRAGDLLGATRMDRPEDVQPSPKTGKVYVMLTNNSRRTEDQVDAANPRARNVFGHIIEISETDGDFASTRSTWEVLLKCGDPSVAHVGATFSSATTKNGWFGMPDNCAIDTEGRLWVATDGNSRKSTGRTDGLWAVDTEGEARGTSKLFFRAPVGAEVCGPVFTPNDETLFLAVQHPGDEGLATFETPATRWPDFKDGMPPRPALMVITKTGGGRIA